MATVGNWFLRERQTRSAVFDSLKQNRVPTILNFSPAQRVEVFFFEQWAVDIAVIFEYGLHD